ncbi:hypothetical protein C3474_27550, partial [Mycobacterium kansasii]
MTVGPLLDGVAVEPVRTDVARAAVGTARWGAVAAVATAAAGSAGAAGGAVTIAAVAADATV